MCTVSCSRVYYIVDSMLALVAFRGNSQHLNDNEKDIKHEAQTMLVIKHNGICANRIISIK